MRPLAAALLVFVLTAAHAWAADPLAEARRLYNEGQYDAAARLAQEATLVEGLADAARVVLGRIQLERFRQSANVDDLDAARESFRRVDAQALDSREQIELTVGLAEALYLDDRFGPAAEMFETVLDRSTQLGGAAHERVLDWWATSLDRQAQLRRPEERAPIYARLSERMRTEIAQDQSSTPASYWLAAAARASGDLDLAWDLSIAGWVRAALARDRGAALRADLDRLVTQAIIPERAAKLPVHDTREAQTGMINEWDSMKTKWSK